MSTNSLVFWGYAVQVVEKFLQIHAVDEEPGYFLGSQYSFAETALTPFVRRYTVVRSPTSAAEDGYIVSASACGSSQGPQCAFEAHPPRTAAELSSRAGRPALASASAVHVNGDNSHSVACLAPTGISYNKSEVMYNQTGENVYACDLGQSSRRGSCPQALPALRNVDMNAIIEAEGLTRLQRWMKVSASDTLTAAIGSEAPCPAVYDAYFLHAASIMAIKWMLVTAFSHNFMPTAAAELIAHNAKVCVAGAVCC